MLIRNEERPVTVVYSKILVSSKPIYFNSLYLKYLKKKSFKRKATNSSVGYMPISINKQIMLRNNESNLPLKYKPLLASTNPRIKSALSR